MHIYENHNNNNMSLLSIVIYLAIIAIIAVIYYKKVGRKAYYLRNCPGIKVSYPFIGNLDMVMNKYLQPYEDLTIYMLMGMTGMSKLFFNKEGLYVYWQGWNPLIFLFTPEAVESVLSSNTEIEKSENYEYLHPWLGTGLLTSTGHKWKSRRKLLTPTFHFRILDDFIPVINEQSMILVSIIGESVNKPIDIISCITMCALDVICETAMGVKINAQYDSEADYVKAIRFVSENFIYRNIHFSGWFDFIFYRTADGKEYSRYLNILHNFTLNVIQERKVEIAANIALKNKDNNDNERDTVLGRKQRLAFLDLLIEKNLSDNVLSEEDIREEVDTFMFEGHDTTSMSIIWSLYLIGIYPEIQNKIYAELESVFGDDKTRFVNHDDLNELKYLERCIKESLRLYPSVPIIARLAKNDIKVMNYTIPKGSTLTVFPYGLHRNEKVFPNPEVYNPDRFLPENQSNLHPYAYIPFSAGPRNCIGQRFALNEEKIIIANVLRNFQLTSVDQRDKMIDSIELVCRPKYPVRIIFKHR